MKIPYIIALLFIVFALQSCDTSVEVSSSQTAIEIEMEVLELYVGTPHVLDHSITNETYNYVKYHTSDKEVFTAKDGIITPVGGGSAILTVSLGNIKETIQINVLDLFTISSYDDVFDDIQLRYGEPLDAPNDPVKEGHTFSGWYLDNDYSQAFVFPDTMPKVDLTIYAKFDVNSYQINFVGEGNVTFKKVVNGNSFGAGLSTANDVYTWGFNGDGRLGLGDEINRLIPTKVNVPLLEGETVHDIAISLYGVTVITSSNRVFGWGGSATYNLQLNESRNLSPVEIDLGLHVGEEILDISSGAESVTVMILTTTRLLGWGYNSYGQLGLPSALEAITEVQEIDTNFLFSDETITQLYTIQSSYMLLTDRGNVYASGIFSNIGLNTETFEKLSIPLDVNETVSQLMFNHNALIILTNQNRLLGIGKRIGDGTNNYYNTYQELNYPLSAEESIISLFSGYNSFGYLTNLGHLYTFGSGNATGTGNVYGNDIYTPTNITPNFNFEAGDTILSVSFGNTGGSVSTHNGYLYGFGSGFATGTNRSEEILLPLQAAPIIGQTTLLDPISVPYNQVFILPQAPTKSGFVFEGWYIDENLTVPFTLMRMPSNTLTLYAKFIGE